MQHHIFRKAIAHHITQTTRGDRDLIGRLRGEGLIRTEGEMIELVGEDPPKGFTSYGTNRQGFRRKRFKINKVGKHDRDTSIRRNGSSTIGGIHGVGGQGDRILSILMAEKGASCSVVVADIKQIPKGCDLAVVWMVTAKRSLIDNDRILLVTHVNLHDIILSPEEDAWQRWSVLKRKKLKTAPAKKKTGKTGKTTKKR